MTSTHHEHHRSSSIEDTNLTINPHHDYKLGNRIERVITSNTHVKLGDLTFERGEFQRAFEGYLNPGYSHVPHHKFANPVPIGVSGFALTLFCLSLVNIGARGVNNAAGLAGLMWFYAGAIELFSGMWCIVIEATWAATLLSSFGGFWIGYGCIVVDVFGLASSYTTPGEGRGTIHDVLGFWVLAWGIFAFIMWLTTLKSTWPLSILILLVVLTLLVLSAAQFSAVEHPTASLNLTRAGGYIGLITSLLAWFVVYEGLCSHENSYWVPPVLLMPGAVTESSKEEV